MPVTATAQSFVRFCHIDDFCQAFEPQWQATLIGNGLRQPKAATVPEFEQSLCKPRVWVDCLLPIEP